MGLTEYLPTPVVKRSSDGYEPINPRKNRRNRSSKAKHANQAAQFASTKLDTTGRGAPSSSWERGAGGGDVAGSGRSRQDQPGPSHNIPRALFKPTGGNKNIKVWINEPPSN